MYSHKSTMSNCFSPGPLCGHCLWYLTRSHLVYTSILTGHVSQVTFSHTLTVCSCLLADNILCCAFILTPTFWPFLSQPVQHPLPAPPGYFAVRDVGWVSTGPLWFLTWSLQVSFAFCIVESSQSLLTLIQLPSQCDQLHIGLLLSLLGNS